MRPFRHAVRTDAASQFARDRAQHSEAAGIDQRYSPNLVERLSEKVLGQRSKREFGRQAEHEIGQKRNSWDLVGLLHGHPRDFSDSR